MDAPHIDRDSVLADLSQYFAIEERQAGDLTAQELSEQFGVSMSQVYRIMNDLIAAGKYRRVKVAGERSFLYRVVVA